MRDQAAFLALVAELEGDYREIFRVREHNLRAWGRIEAGADDILDYGALAYTIHTLYGILENYFLRISKFFENNLPSDSWHKALVERMALDIGGVRPALLPDGAGKKDLLELLKFRHKFRHLYGEDLDPEQTSRVQRHLTAFLELFPEIHQNYCRKLKQIGEAL
jgi:hypothetical protein